MAKFKMKVYCFGCTFIRILLSSVSFSFVSLSDCKTKVGF